MQEGLEDKKLQPGPGFSKFKGHSKGPTIELFLVRNSFWIDI